MSLTYGMPYHLEDTTGNLSDSTFTDLHQRLSFSVRTTMRGTDRTVIMIHNLPSEMGHSGLMVPTACLDFGANNALGTVKIGQGQTVEMDKYLSRVSRNSSMVRKFDASDSQTYTWTYTATEDAEWTCTNSRGYVVASYSLKSEHEPSYEHSSGCLLYVEEPYGLIAGELLASLTIMRHIAKYRL